METSTSETLETGEPDIKDKLLKIVEDGDAIEILSTEYGQSLNELIRLEFISIEDDKLRLTEKGERAKVLGVKYFAEQDAHIAKTPELPDFATQKPFRTASNRIFLVLLLFFFIALIALLILVFR